MHWIIIVDFLWTGSHGSWHDGLWNILD